MRLIVSVTVVLRLAEPSKPVMVSVKVPVGVEWVAETVSVEVVVVVGVFGSVTFGGLNVNVVPTGPPVTLLQTTVPAYAPVGVAVTL